MQSSPLAERLSSTNSLTAPGKDFDQVFLSQLAGFLFMPLLVCSFLQIKETKTNVKIKYTGLQRAQPFLSLPFRKRKCLQNVSWELRRLQKSKLAR